MSAFDLAGDSVQLRRMPVCISSRPCWRLAERQTALIAYAALALGRAVPDRLDLARAVVAVDGRADHIGALFSAVLRRVLPHGFLQCVAQLPDPLGQAGELARVSGDVGWLLAELSARRAATRRRRPT